MIEPHYEIWVGNADQEGSEPEFKETFTSLIEAQDALKIYHKDPTQYAYIRDMNNEGKILHD